MRTTLFQMQGLRVNLALQNRLAAVVEAAEDLQDRIREVGLITGG